MRDAGSSTAPLDAARTAFAAGDWPAALAAAQAAVARRPDSVEALVLAVNSALRSDRLALAVPWLEALLRHDPGRPHFTRLISTAHNDVGMRQLAAGDFAAAGEAFKRALAAWPDNTDALANQARLVPGADQESHVLPDVLQRGGAADPLGGHLADARETGP